MKKINQIKLTGTLSMLIAGTIVSVNPADLYKDMDGLNKLYDLSRSGLSAVAVPGGGTGSGSNVMSQKELKERMICDLEFVRNTFKAQYAPCSQFGIREPGEASLLVVPCGKFFRSGKSVAHEEVGKTTNIITYFYRCVNVCFCAGQNTYLMNNGRLTLFANNYIIITE